MIEQMKFEVLERQLQECVMKVCAVQSLIQSMLQAAEDPNIPVVLEDLTKVNIDRYALAVLAAQKVVADLSTSFPE